MPLVSLTTTKTTTIDNSDKNKYDQNKQGGDLLNQSQVRLATADEKRWLKQLTKPWVYFIFDAFSLYAGQHRINNEKELKSHLV